MTKIRVTVDVTNIDWRQLRAQKADVVVRIDIAKAAGRNIDDLRGLLHLLDHIQDQAAEVLGEEAVFGELRDD